MDGPNRRDINELLVNGYFKTSRAKSPSSSPTPPNVSTFLNTSDPATHHRSRHRAPRGLPPPPPTVEDEWVSLNREHPKAPLPTYHPPSRGIVEQNPIILEADVSAAEAARLQTAPIPKDGDDNSERRFVLIPQPEKSPKPEDAKIPQKPSTLKTEQTLNAAPKNKSTQSPIERPRSRQDLRAELPSLQTKVPRDIPPKYRRSASSFTGAGKDGDTPRASESSRTGGTSFLSPSSGRNGKDYFLSSSAPRYPTQDTFGGRSSGTPINKKRLSGSPGSRPGSPSSEKRRSGSYVTTEAANRPIKIVNEKPSRHQQLAEDFSRRNRRSSPQSDRPRSSRNSQLNPSQRYYSSSEDELEDTDIDSGHRRRRDRDYYAEDDLRSPSRHRLSADYSGTSSKHASPLPSPKVSPSQLPRSEIVLPVREQKKSQTRTPSPLNGSQDPRSSERTNYKAAAAPSRQRPIPSGWQPTGSTTALPIVIPSRADSLKDGYRDPTASFEDRSSTAHPASKPSWPPRFQPPSSSLQKPVGALRRYSEEIEKSGIDPLPSCPRTKFTRGRNDWLTLPQCPSFDICPHCFKGAMALTEFRNRFVPAPYRPSSIEVLCDFGSSPWYRIAWLITRQDRRRDLNLFYSLSSIAATAPPCLGKHEAVRQWHSITDPKTGLPIRHFDVCYSCVKSIETLLPPIRGIFVRPDSTTSQSSLPRVCDLRFDSKRFIKYFDALETLAEKAENTNTPVDLLDTRNLASMIRRLASIPECEQDAELIDRRWYVITQLPEFTVCEECFDEVVFPLLQQGKAIPSMFNKSLQRLPRASCQLYSARMRRIIEMAVAADDYKGLATRARERKMAELNYREELDVLRRQIRQNTPLLIREKEKAEEEWKRWE